MWEKHQQHPTTKNYQELPTLDQHHLSFHSTAQHTETATGLQDGVLVPSEVIAGNMAIKTMSDKQCQNCQNTMKHYENTMNPVCSNVLKCGQVVKPSLSCPKAGATWDKWCYSRRLLVHWLVRTWRCKVNGSGIGGSFSCNVDMQHCWHGFGYHFIYIYHLYDFIWSWYIPPENPCVLWWSWKAANVTHGYDSRLSGSLLKQTCYPHKWKTSHVEANPVQVTWTYILQRPPFTSLQM